VSAGARSAGRETGEAAGPIDAERLRKVLAQREPAAARSSFAVRVVRAPGRVNLIGEHTDYNEGFVLPVAIDLEIRIALVPTDDRRVDLTLLDGNERDGFDLDAIPPRSGGWIDYVAATAWSLADDGLRLRGFRGVLGSNLPMSSGLSSSAALEMASAWALLDPPDPIAQGIDRMTLARLAQRGENEYVGVKSGLMDQFASSLGRARAAMLLDCRSLDHRAVGLPLARHRLVVCDSGSPRRLDASEYNARRAECEEAVAIIASRDPSVRSLRDVDLDKLIGARFALDERIFRRAEHIVRENERVLATVDALEAGDLEAVGRLFAQSHASLRDLFEVSSPELDALVEIAGAVPGVVAARMTGAGFGGCTVNIVARDAVDRLREAVDNEYPARTGRRARVFAVEPADGAGPVA
jgi:galactokinase